MNKLLFLIMLAGLLVSSGTTLVGCASIPGTAAYDQKKERGMD